MLAQDDKPKINLLNLINNHTYTEEQLKEITIYNLRVLARNYGLSNPTTKKKAELIAFILQGKQDKLVVNKGRPPLIGNYVPRNNKRKELKNQLQKAVDYLDSIVKKL